MLIKLRDIVRPNREALTKKVMLKQQFEGVVG
jgi:hypothetical protein